jgi:protein-tyrosine phosphatase
MIDITMEESKMIDIHTHILSGMDDGADTISESLLIIKEALNSGITDIVLTPHYIEGTKYAYNNKHKKNMFNQLKQIIDSEGIKINLYLGNEIFISNNIVDLINKDEVYTINGSRYLLIELPLKWKFENTEKIIYNLINNGYIPIIAHPERYEIFYSSRNLIEELIKMGVLLQGNIGSLIGIYGKKVKKQLEYMLKNNMIDLLASDVHQKNGIYKKLDLSIKRLKKIVGNDRTTILINENPKKIICDENLERI